MIVSTGVNREAGKAVLGSQHTQQLLHQKAVSILVISCLD